MLQARGMAYKFRPLTHNDEGVVQDMASAFWMQDKEVGATTWKSAPSFFLGQLLMQGFSIVCQCGHTLTASQCCRLTVQAAAAAYFLYEDVCVLPLLFFSDGADLRSRGQKFHPLLLYVGSFTMEGIRHRDGYSRIAMLPVLDASALGLKASSERYVQHKQPSSTMPLK